jgi:putative hydrolase of the HAD superfamily
MSNKFLDGIRAVLFDAGNTIAMPDWARISNVVEQVSSRQFNETELQRKISAILAEADNDQDFLRKLADRLIPVGWHYRRLYSGLGIGEQEIENLISALNAEHQKRHLWSKLNKDAIPVFEELKRRKMTLGVISNSEDGQVKALLSQMGVDKYFDLHLDSHVIGLAKPDPKIFLHAINELNVLPQEAVYVGDMYRQDVMGAQRAGLRAVLYDPLEVKTQSDVISIGSLKELIQ